MRWLTQQGLGADWRLEAGWRRACRMGADSMGADRIPDGKVSPRTGISSVPSKTTSVSPTCRPGFPELQLPSWLLRRLSGHLQPRCPSAHVILTTPPLFSPQLYLSEWHPGFQLQTWASWLPPSLVMPTQSSSRPCPISLSPLTITFIWAAMPTSAVANSLLTSLLPPFLFRWGQSST